MDMKPEKEVLEKSKGHTRVQWAVAILACSAPLTYGLQCGWVSPMTKVLQSTQSPVGRPLTDTEISLIAGVPSISAIFGILTLVYVVDTFGRKSAIFLMSALQLTCWIIKICPSNPTSLIIARLICGLGAGGCFHVVPMYVREISQDSIRGTLGSMATLLQNFGILAMYALGGYVDYYTVLYIVVGLPIVAMALLIKAPESPSFLVKMGKLEEATASIAFLRGLNITDPKVKAEVDYIKEEDDYFKSIPHISFFNIFKEKAWRRGFIIMVLIIIIHALSGVFAIINYANVILGDSDVNISPELQSLGIPICLSIGTLLTMSSVDKLGRKLILSTTFVLSMLAHCGLACCMLLRSYGWATPEWFPMAAILFIVLCYGTGISPIPFILMAEMFNFQIRAKLMACLCILAWFFSFFQLTGFTAITNAFGAYTSFFVFGGINLLGAIIVLILLPETGNKTVEQIEKELRKEKRIEEKSSNS